METGIFLTALFGALFPAEWLLHHRQEGSTITSTRPICSYMLCGIRVGMTDRRLNKIGGGGIEEISSNSIRRITAPFCVKPTGRSRLLLPSPLAAHTQTYFQMRLGGKGALHM